MTPNFNFILCFLTISSTSFACQSMNGISKKAVLLGLDRNSKAYEENRLKESSSNKVSSDESINYNNTLREIFRLSSSNNFTEDVWTTYARQRNNSKPISSQSLTKSKEYLTLKYFNTTGSENIFVKTFPHFNESVKLEGISMDLFMKILNASRHSPNGFSPALLSPYPREIPGRLMHEPELAAEEPGVKPGILKPGESVVLTMQPPANAPRDASGNLLENEEDMKVNVDWGGDCVVADWKRCYNITVVGNPSLPDPRPPKPKEKLPKYYQLQLDCFSTDPEVAVDFPWLCLNNGWTVNRCHLLCMSKCNRDLLLTRKWDYYVSHEGSCKT